MDAEDKNGVIMVMMGVVSQGLQVADTPVVTENEVNDNGMSLSVFTCLCPLVTKMYVGRHCADLRSTSVASRMYTVPEPQPKPQRSANFREETAQRFNSISSGDYSFTCV